MRFIFDIDGTVSFDGVKIDDAIVSRLRQLEADGSTVSFASARPIRDLLPIIPDFATNHLLIGGNGSIVKDENNELSVIKPMNDQTFNSIKQIIEKYDLDYIVDDIWNYSASITNDNNILNQLDPAKLAKNVKLEDIEEPIKIILLDIQNADYDSISQELDDFDNLNVVKHTGEQSIDITALGINKYTTLRKYTAEPYFGFGNDHNDAELLLHAAKSVWVGGFNDRLKNINLAPDVTVLGNPAEINLAIDRLMTEK